MTDQRYRPSAAARRRAAAAGIDLDALRTSDPQRYRIFCAEEVCVASDTLQRTVGEHFFALFPERELYALPDASSGRVRLLCYPPLDSAAFERWDERLAALPRQWPGLPVYNRTVEDVRGLRRELALPRAPDAWRGEAVVVGPFDSEAEAAEFGRSATADGALAFDLFPLGSVWICDLFPLDSADLG